MTTTVDAGLDLRDTTEGQRGQIAALLTFLAENGAPALRSVAVRFLTEEFLRVDDVDGLTRQNLAWVGLAIEVHAPHLTADWQTVLTAVGDA